MLSREIGTIWDAGFSWSNLRSQFSSSEYSEVNDNHYNSMQNIERFLLPAKLTPQKDTLERIGDRSANAVYINGILSPVSMSMYQNKILENLFNRPIELLYNESNGFILDLYECVIDRSMYNYSPVAQFASKVIEEKLKEHEKVLLIGYSQGSIILSSALKILKTRLPITDLLRLNFVSFAPGFLNYDVPHVYSEHFCNTNDPVVKIGALYDSKKIKGKIFTRHGSGHLLVADYLSKLANTEFGLSSRTYQMIKNKKAAKRMFTD